MPTLLAIDQGTTSSRAILFSTEGDILSVRQKELTLHYPHKGWVEQNPEDIWEDTLCAAQEIVSEQGDDIAAIGITNQRETTVVWDRKTGKPIYNAIVWQDRRTADYCASLKEQGHEESVQEKTGLLLDPYFSATKIKWILDNIDGAREKSRNGELAFGTIDTFLLWRLTGGEVHATDATNASRTMLYNIRRGEWDADLLELFDIDSSLLPEVCDNAHDFGVAQIKGREFRIAGMAGDQQAALIGQACFEKGMVKSTYGTGCFALMNIGTQFKKSENRLLTTIGYRLNGETTYAIEGAIFVAGAAIQWLRDNLEFFSDSKESETLATSVDDNNDVYFIPAFTGLGAPYWNPNATAMISGLTRESTKAHITRAALEAQAYQTSDLIQAFTDDTSEDIKQIRADGGLTHNHFTMQFLADILDCRVDIPKVNEATALGAAYLAGLQVGLYDGLTAISDNWQSSHQFEVSMSEDEREALLAGWKREISRILS